MHFPLEGGRIVTPPQRPSVPTTPDLQQLNKNSCDDRRCTSSKHPVLGSNNHEFRHNQLNRVRVRLSAGALIGLLLGAVLPPAHLSSDSKDVVKVGMGLVWNDDRHPSWSAGCFGQKFLRHANNELTEMSAKVILLDRVLAHYGPEAKEARDVLHVAVTRLLDAIVVARRSRKFANGIGARRKPKSYTKKFKDLAQNDTQHSMQTQALSYRA